MFVLVSYNLRVVRAIFMLAPHEQATAYTDYVSQLQTSTNDPAPPLTKARNVIGVTVSARLPGLVRASPRLDDISMQSKAGKLSKMVANLFVGLVENTAELSKHTTHATEFDAIDCDEIKRGTLNVSAYLNRFGEYVRRGLSTVQQSALNNSGASGSRGELAEDEYMHGADEPTSILDAFESAMRGGHYDNEFFDAEEDEFDAEPSNGYLRGVNPGDPLVSVFVEMTYGTEEGERDSSACDDHFEFNDKVLKAYSDAASRETTDVGEYARSISALECAAFSAARQVVAGTIGVNQAEQGLGVRSNETLQSITIWMCSATLISMFSVLKSMVDAATAESGMSALSNITDGVRQECLNNTSSSHIADVTSPGEAIAAMMAQDSSSSAPQRTAKQSRKPRKLKRRPRSKRTMISEGAELSKCPTLSGLNLLANAYAVNGTNRAQKSMSFGIGAGIMSRAAHGDLSPILWLSAVDALAHRGDNCHPDQSNAAFTASNGGTYFVGGLQARDPDGFLYFSPPVPSLTIRIDPNEVREGYLLECFYPHPEGRVAPVLGACYTLLTTQEIKRILIPGVIPPAVASQVARRELGLGTVFDCSHQSDGTSDVVSNMKRGMYEELGVEYVPNDFNAGKDLGGLMPFDKRHLGGTKSALVGCESNIQRLGSRIRACVDLAEQLIEKMHCSRAKRLILMQRVREWAADTLFEGVSHEYTDNSDAIRAIFHVISAGSLKDEAPLPAEPMTDTLPPIADFVARQTVDLADILSSTEGQKITMGYFTGLSSLHMDDDDVDRRPGEHYMGPGGGGKSRLVKQGAKLTCWYIDDTGVLRSSTIILASFTPKSFQSTNEPFKYDHAVLIVEEMPAKNLSSEDENGGASAVLKTLMTSNYTTALVMCNDPASRTRITIVVRNAVRIQWKLIDNGTEEHLESAIKRRTRGILMADKAETANDINYAINKEAHTRNSADNKNRKRAMQDEFKQMQVFVCLVEAMILSGAIAPIDVSIVVTIVTGIFSKLKKTHSQSVNGSDLEDIGTIARILCITEFFEGEFKRRGGQFFGKRVTARRVQAANWGLAIKTHHVIMALGMIAPYMFPQGQDAFSQGVASMLKTRIANVCANNRIDDYEDRIAKAVELKISSEEATAGYVDSRTEAAVCRVVRTICPYREQMHDRAKTANSAADTIACYDMDYAVFRYQGFVAKVCNIIATLKVDNKPTVNTIQSLMCTLEHLMVKVYPRTVSDDAFNPTVEDTTRAMITLPMIKRVGNNVLVLWSATKPTSSNMEGLIGAIKEFFNNASTPPQECLFTPGMGATYNMIAIGRGLGRDSKTLADVDVRVDSVGNPIGEVSKAAHTHLIIPNYAHTTAPARMKLVEASECPPDVHVWNEKCNEFANRDAAEAENADDVQQPGTGNPTTELDPIDDDWSCFSETCSTPSRSHSGGLRDSSASRSGWVDAERANDIAGGAIMMCSWDEFSMAKRAALVGNDLHQIADYHCNTAEFFAGLWASTAESDNIDENRTDLAKLSELFGSAIIDPCVDPDDQASASRQEPAAQAYVVEAENYADANTQAMEVDGQSDEHGDDQPAFFDPPLQLMRVIPPRQVIVIPNDLMMDVRFNKPRVMARRNPCFVKHAPSTRINNPKGATPFHLLIAGCTSFEDYATRFFTSPADYMHRAMVHDPNYGTRDAYPDYILSKYAERSRAKWGEGGSYIMLGTRPMSSRAASSKRRRMPASSPDDDTPASFEGVLKKGTAKERHIEELHAARKRAEAQHMDER